MTNLEIVSYYAASALIVAWAVATDLIGGFQAAALQGALSVTLVLVFGPWGVFVAFVLVGHVVAPRLLSHWIEMIHDANR